jgi:hypothetical protein
MNKKGKLNQIIFITMFLILIVGAGISGYFLGQNAMLNSIYPEPNEVLTIFGQITSIDGNSLIIETSSFERYIPEQEQKLTKITVNTNEQTKISEQNFSPENPSELTETIISFSDLTVGDSVRVSSSENIKGKNQITATEIILQSSPINTE